MGTSTRVGDLGHKKGMEYRKIHALYKYGWITLDKFKSICATPLIRNTNGINFFDKCKQKEYKRLFELANQYSRVEVKYEHK